jgi:hypothetical protein
MTVVSVAEGRGWAVDPGDIRVVAGAALIRAGEVAPSVPVVGAALVRVEWSTGISTPLLRDM